MLLKALKSNQAFLFLLIPLTAVALWFRSFLNAGLFPFYPGEDQMLLYQPISLMLEGRPLLNHIMALIFVIFLAFLVHKLNVQYSFIRIRSFLPPTIFILITSGIPSMHAMHPVYPAALFLVLAIDRVFNGYDKENIHSNAFDSGIFLAIGSLFYLNLIYFFPLIWFGFIILKPKVNWREYVLSTLGFAIPWLAAFAYYTATGSENELVTLFRASITLHLSFLRDNLPMQIFVGFLIFLTLLGSFFLLWQYEEKKISSRRFFKVFFWIFLISTILIFANPGVSQEIIVILALPLCYLISNYFIFMKRSMWGEVLMYLLVAAVIYLQFLGSKTSFSI